MIFKLETLAPPQLCGALLTVVFNLIAARDAAANIPFSIENVASLAKKLAAEPFKPPKDKPLQLRAFLQQEKDTATKDTLTETWSYMLQP